MTDYSDNWARLAAKWSVRAREELRDDPFAAFFFAYMALLAAAARCEDRTLQREEGPLLIRYFQRGEELRVTLESKACGELGYFADRSAESSGAPVLEFMRRPRGISYERKDALLIAFAERRAELDNSEFMEAVAVLIYGIRNNLFHGDKDYDSKSDREVLAQAVPLILSAIAVFEGLETPDG